MQPFNMETFTRRLVAESLFYDEEYGVLGTLSLVDDNAFQERFVASYLPENDVYLVEEATEWEDYERSAGDEIGYALAVDSNEHGRYNTPEEAADALLLLANEHGLVPSITILFEEDEVA